MDFLKDATLIDGSGNIIPFSIEEIQQSVFEPTRISGHIFGIQHTNCRCSIKKNDFGIHKVIFNEPATVVIWNDGSKTVVKCQDGDTYSKELGLAMCIAKKHLGNHGNFNNVFKKYINENNM